MIVKTFVTALVFAAAPIAASAACNWGKAETASSCMTGYVWDGEQRACVPATTG